MAPLPEYAAWGTPPPHRWADDGISSGPSDRAELVPRAADETLRVLTPVVAPAVCRLSPQGRRQHAGTRRASSAVRGRRPPGGWGLPGPTPGELR